MREQTCLFHQFRFLRFDGSDRSLLKGEIECIFLGLSGNAHDPALGQTPEQQLFRKRFLDVLLNHSGQWTSPE